MRILSRQRREDLERPGGLLDGFGDGDEGLPIDEARRADGGSRGLKPTMAYRANRLDDGFRVARAIERHFGDAGESVLREGPGDLSQPQMITAGQPGQRREREPRDRPPGGR